MTIDERATKAEACRLEMLAVDVANLGRVQLLVVAEDDRGGRVTFAEPLRIDVPEAASPAAGQSVGPRCHGVQVSAALAAQCRYSLFDMLRTAASKLVHRAVLNLPLDWQSMPDGRRLRIVGAQLKQ